MRSGCLQQSALVGLRWVTEASVNEWADTNGLVVLQPERMVRLVGLLEPSRPSLSAEERVADVRAVRDGAARDRATLNFARCRAIGVGQHYLVAQDAAGRDATRHANKARASTTAPKP